MSDAKNKECDEGLLATDIAVDGEPTGFVDIHRPDHTHGLGIVVKKPLPGLTEGPDSFYAKRDPDGSYRPVSTGASVPAAPTSCGPAKVNSEAFRDGWSRIFGGKAERGQA